MEHKDAIFQIIIEDDAMAPQIQKGDVLYHRSYLYGNNRIRNFKKGDILAAWLDKSLCPIVREIAAIDGPVLTLHTPNGPDIFIAIDAETAQDRNLPLLTLRGRAISLHRSFE